MMADEDFEVASAGCAKSYPLQCSALRKNGHVVIRDRVCKIVQMSTSKTGKHGHAKVNLVGIDIFTGRKLQDCCPSTHNVQVPVITTADLIVVDVGEQFLSLMEQNGSLRSSVRVPEGNMGSELKSKFNNLTDDQTLVVTIVQAMDGEMIKAIKLTK